MVAEMMTVGWERMADDKKGRNVRAGEAWVSARIPEAASVRIAALAAREERSVSFIVRRLILEALESERYQGV
jgi:hypothetical protein